MTLYNLRTDGDEYRINKFTNDLEVESSYLVSLAECECPAGSRSTCRHRQMLPILLAEDLLNSGGFYDYDNEQVLLPVETELTIEPPSVTVSTVDFDSASEGSNPSEAATVVMLDNPEQLHNAISEAIGETEPCGKATPLIKRRI